MELRKILINTSIDCYLAGFWKIKNKNDKIKFNNFIKKVEKKYSS